MAISDFDALFDDGKVIRYRQANCFMALQWFKDVAEREKIDISKSKMIGVRFYYTNTLLGNYCYHHYLEYVFKKFNKYILTDSVEDLLNAGYVEVSTEAPAPIMMGILMMLRYPKEFPETPFIFTKLVKYYPDATPLQTDILFLLSDVIRWHGGDVVMRSASGSHNSNHTIYEKCTLTYDALRRFHSQSFSCDMRPAYEHMKFNGFVSKTFADIRRWDEPSIDESKLLIKNSEYPDIDSLVLPLFKELS